MSTFMKLSLMGLATLLLIAVTARAGDIPKGYRGTYASADKSIKMELKESKAIFDVNGVLYKADVEREDSTKIYDGLSKGKPYVYIQNPVRGQNVLDVFWITPEAVAQNAIGGLMSYRAHILYLRFNREQPTDVPSIKVVYSKEGMVLLDTMTRKWQAGWGIQFAEYELTRAEVLRK